MATTEHILIKTGQGIYTIYPKKQAINVKLTYKDRKWQATAGALTVYGSSSDSALSSLIDVLS